MQCRFTDTLAEEFLRGVPGLWPAAHGGRFADNVFSQPASLRLDPPAVEPAGAKDLADLLSEWLCRSPAVLKAALPASLDLPQAN